MKPVNVEQIQDKGEWWKFSVDQVIDVQRVSG